MTNNNIIILTPLYNDWNNLNRLLQEINQHTKNIDNNFELIVINDCSPIKGKINTINLNKIIRISIINLKKNLGSQRAIAIGLKYVVTKEKKIKKIIVIDSDGQDEPSIIPEIIKSSNDTPQTTITINRAKRSDPLWFKFLYEMHYYALLVFTGKRIRYGNYGLIYMRDVTRLIESGDLWGAYSSAIANNFTKIKKIYKDRKERYSGQSKMSFFNLLKHSIRVFSVLKVRFFFFSFLYYLIYIFFNTKINILFYLITFSLIGLNIINFIVSYSFKKKIHSEYNDSIDTVDEVK
jgi:hypothetical protein|tara:strand:- start:210 stop:1088 length:879 start_codon:yes stop_codon:yes gene_type:complete